MPINNQWAIIGAAIATIATFVLNALLNFFATGNPWPVDAGGWAKIVIPALCAGAAAVLSPHYSVSEAKTGHRDIDSGRDAPVFDAHAEKILHAH